MTLAQFLFAAALGTVALVIVLFAVYVFSSTTWGDRWTPK